jgi:16S rRNA G966 N2-methylase RsmD
MTQEQIVDDKVLDLIEEKVPGSKNIILEHTNKSSKRLAMLHILDDDRKLLEQYKNIIRNEQYCSHYAEDVVQILREYVKVADTEVKEHGEVMTPLTLVEEMLDKLPNEVWTNKDLKWLDPCNGVGTFPSLVVKKLMVGLKDVIVDDCERYRHIIENMIYVCEIQAKNMFLFHSAFDREDDYELNTYFGSFLDKGFDEHMLNVWGVDKFDIVLGNPPYKYGLHHKFVNKSFDLLNENGFLNFLHPSLVYISRKGVDRTEEESKLLEISEENYTHITLIKAHDYFTDVYIYTPLSITIIKKEKCNNVYVLNKFMNMVDEQKLNSCSDILLHGNPIVKVIKNKIENKMVLDFQDMLHKKDMVSNFYLIIATLSGHKPTKKHVINPDFYTMVNKKYENDYEFSIIDDLTIERKGQKIMFNSYDEAVNGQKYLLTKFARFCLSFSKINQALFSKELDAVPFMDFNVDWTDEMLFDYFELTEEERNYINTFIPNYYERDFQNN